MTLAATTSPLIRQYTLEEFWELENPPDGGHYELIAGVLYMVPPPEGPHTTVVSRLNRLFIAYLVSRPNSENFCSSCCYLDLGSHLLGARSDVCER